MLFGKKTRKNDKTRELKRRCARFEQLDQLVLPGAMLQMIPGVGYTPIASFAQKDQQNDSLTAIVDDQAQTYGPNLTAQAFKALTNAKRLGLNLSDVLDSAQFNRQSASRGSSSSSAANANALQWREDAAPTASGALNVDLTTTLGAGSFDPFDDQGFESDASYPLAVVSDSTDLDKTAAISSASNVAYAAPTNASNAPIQTQNNLSDVFGPMPTSGSSGGVSASEGEAGRAETGASDSSEDVQTDVRESTNDAQTDANETSTQDENQNESEPAVDVEPIERTLAFGADLHNWTISQYGGTDSGKGGAVGDDEGALTTEGDSFLVEMRQTFTIPEAPTTLSFAYKASFDAGDETSINDAFEVALLDSDGYSLVKTFADDRDAYFNLTEGLEISLGAQTSVKTVGDSTVVTLDLSDVPVGTQATVVLRLVNNDDDTQGWVRLSSAADSNPPVVSTPVLEETPEGSTVVLATPFTDPDTGDAHTATVDWGDGTIETATVEQTSDGGIVRGEHIYADNGKYDVVVNVVDSFGLTGSATSEATITNVAPTLGTLTPTFDAQFLDDAALEQYVVLSGDFSDPGYTSFLAGTEETFFVVVDWGGGTVETVDPTSVTQGAAGRATTGEYSLRHQYAEANIYTAKVTVRDDDGGEGVVETRFGYGEIEICVPVETPQTTDLNVVRPVWGAEQHAVVPVIVKSTNNIDATKLDVSTVKFYPGEATDVDDRGEYYDVAPFQDGVKDAIYHFSAWEAQIRPTDKIGWITAQFEDGTPFFGFDAIPATALSGEIPDALDTRTAADSGSKFFVVNSAPESVYRYTDSGAANSDYYLGATAVDSRDITANADGSKIWVVDGSTFNVSITSPDGWALGAWRADDLIDPEGIATDGTDMWIVDATLRGVFRYDGAANLTTGAATADEFFPLAPENADPKGMATDGEKIWIVDDAADSVFVYDVDSGDFLGSWTLDAANADAAGITNDPTGASDSLWIVDSADLLVYEYADATELLTGAASVVGSFALAEGNTNPTGVVDPAVSVATPQNDSSYDADATVLISGSAKADSSTDSPVVAVFVDGTAVDAFDAAGNFFYETTVQAGENLREVVVIDANGETATTTVSYFGATEGSGVDEDLQFDVSPSFKPDYAHTSFDARVNTLYAELAIENVGQYSANAPFYVGITNISDLTVTPLDPVGVTSDGIPYYDLSAAIEGDALDPTETTLWTNVAFSNPNRAQFDYDLVYVYQTNRAPEFVTSPTIEAYPGVAYTYAASAVDPDGDALTYSLLSSPKNMKIDAQTGAISWTPDALGVYNVSIQVEDGRGGSAVQSYAIEVVVAPENRPPVITSVPVTEVTVSSESSSPTGELVQTNLENWEVVVLKNCGYGYSWWGTDHCSPNWDVDGDQVIQHNNADGSMLISDFEMSGERIEGTWKVSQDPDNDDDWIGFVFGYQDEEHFYLFDWKMGAIDWWRGSNAEAGMTVRVVDSESKLDMYDLANTDGSEGKIETIYKNDVPWEKNVEYRFTLDYFPGHFHITVKQGETVLMDEEFADSTYLSGKFGFYNYSQGEVLYKGFKTQEIENANYFYDVEATDPDGDAIVYSLVDAPEGMQINSKNGAIMWNPTAEQIGTHTITVVATDACGTTDTQIYTLNVLADPTNHAPVIVSEPITDVLLNDEGAVALADTVVAVDADEDEIAYTLIEAPEGMTLDAKTGALRWNVTSANLGTHTVTVQASDGRGGYDSQTYVLNVREAGTATIKGTVYDDANNNGRRDSTLVRGDNPLIVFVVDTSGSMEYQYSGTRVGDLNNDGRDSRLDTTIYAMTQYRQQLVDMGLGDSAELALVDFSGSIRTNDMNPAESGKQYFTTADADADENGVPDFLEAIRKLKTPWWDGTNFDGALRQAISVINSKNESERETTVVFLTDGVPNREGTGATYAQQLRDMGVTVFGLGIGSGGDYSVEGLKKVDPNAVWLDNMDDLYDVFAGLNGDVIQFDESGLAGVTVYVDFNNNGKFDANEPGAVSDSDGVYEITNLASGNYVLRVVEPEGRVQTQPTLDSGYSIALSEGEMLRGKDFGLYQYSSDVEKLKIVSEPTTTATVGTLYRYDVEVFDPANETLTYTLLAAPEGMTIHPELGVLVWTPTSSDVGTRQAVIRVQNESGAFATQAICLTVSPQNTAPTITTETLPTPILLNSPFSAVVSAQDAEGDAFEFSLVDAPDGATIDADTGEISWTPTVAGLGFALTVAVVDARGARSEKTYLIDVAETLPNDDPTITSTPRVRTRLDLPYVYLVEASDPNGDPLTFSVDGPDGMTIDAKSGVISWTPTGGAALGLNRVVLSVSDGRGGVATQEFELEVVSAAENSAPIIVSNPSQATTLGKTYVYKAEAFDADGDSVFWSLVEAPEGMSVGILTGEVYWTPTSEQLGSSTITLRCADAYGGSTTQTFALVVRTANRPPVISSNPKTTANVDEPYACVVQATDPDGDEVSYSFLEDYAPDGMTIDAQNGLIRWTPTSADVGKHTVIVVVRDSFGGLDSQRFDVVVSEAEVNKTPVITSTPTYRATVDRVYSYQVEATDPEGDALTFALASAPNGMTIDATTGAISWTPTSRNIGSTLVSVTATDAFGNVATQTYALVVRENQAPVITSTPGAYGAPKTPYSYDVVAKDAEGDAIEYRLVEGPDGMTLDAASGRLRWTPEVADEGTAVRAVVEAVDAFGASARQEFTISVRKDETAPTVILSASATYVVGGDPIKFEARATDDCAVENVWLIVGNERTALNWNATSQQYEATVDMTSSGVFVVYAEASDYSGNVGKSDSLNIRVYDPNDYDCPQITFHAIYPQVYDETVGGLVDGEAITGDAIHTNPTLTYLADVELSISDANMAEWYVDYALVGEIDLDHLQANPDAWGSLGSGFGALDHARFRIDPTLLANDAWVLRVTAYDVNGCGWMDGFTFSVEGGAKLGQFSFTTTDMNFSLNGISLTVARTYDTYRSSVEGDFGYGWTMSISDANIVETTKPGSDMQEGDRVYITTPDGDRVGFTYKPELYPHAYLFHFGTTYTPKFESDPGVDWTLSCEEGSYIRDGLFGGLFSAFDGCFNPSKYVLTSSDGTSYYYDQTEGLQKIVDANGIEVTVTPTEISHSVGGKITFERDVRGRITSITDHTGATVKYSYDKDGNLASYSNQADSSTNTASLTYKYKTDPAHFLEEIYDKEGDRVFLAEFDESGRLVGSTDALGNVTQQEFNPGEMNGVTRDANGNKTTIWYNERGAVTSEEKTVVNVITGETETCQKTCEYADPNFPDLETRIVDYDGTATEYEYDADGNKTKIALVSADGTSSIASEKTYNSDGKVLTETIPGSSSVAYVYDDKGNTTSIAVGSGAAASTYNSEGKETSSTDLLGNTTQMEYPEVCPCTAPRKLIWADGSYEMRYWNKNGGITRVEYYEPDGTLTKYVATDYDDLNRKTRETTGQGDDRLVVEYTYDGDSDRIATETNVCPADASKNETKYSYYDKNGNLLRQVDVGLDPNDPDAGIFYKYDGNGNVIWQRDAVGNVTTYIYDALDRVIEERDALYWAEQDVDWSSMSDAEIRALISTPTPAPENGVFDESHSIRYAYSGDNVVEKIDQNGRRITYEYDQLDQKTKEVWYDATDDVTPIYVVEYAYDADGKLISAVSPDAEYALTYNDMGYLKTLSVDYPWTENFETFTLTYEYDAMGNTISVADSTGYTVHSEYNARNILASRWTEGLEGGDVSVDFTWTVTGQIDSVTRWADTTRTVKVGTSEYVYDLAGQATQIIHRDALDQVLAEYDYDYDFAGRLIEEALSSVVEGASRTALYDYDELGQIISAMYDNGQENETFAWDANGNSALPGAVIGAGNRLLSDGTFNYEYDAAGNRISRTRINAVSGEVNYTEYKYDYNNRLVSTIDYSSKDGIILHEETYRSDMFGRRIQIVSDGVETISTYNGIGELANEWARFDATGNVIQRFLFGDNVDQLIAQWTPTDGVLWALTDRLGSVRDLMTNAGQIVQHINYTAFGTPLFITPEGGLSNYASTHPYAFTGRVWDALTGMNYLRARTFDPATGKFTSADPLRFEAGDMNLYRYLVNSPFSGTDPSGKMGFIDCAALLSGLFTSIASAYVTYKCYFIFGVKDENFQSRRIGYTILAAMGGFAIGWGLVFVFLKATVYMLGEVTATKIATLLASFGVSSLTVSSCVGIFGVPSNPGELVNYLVNMYCTPEETNS